MPGASFALSIRMCQCGLKPGFSGIVTLNSLAYPQLASRNPLRAGQLDEALANGVMPFACQEVSQRSRLVEGFDHRALPLVE